MKPTSVSIALLDCENLLDTLREFKLDVSEDFGIDVSIAVLLEPSRDVIADALLEYDILICDPRNALLNVSGVLHESDYIKGRPVAELLVNVISSQEPVKYIETIISRVALLKNGFENLGVCFAGDSMRILTRSATLKLRDCFKEDKNLQLMCSFDYGNTGLKLNAMVYTSILHKRSDANTQHFNQILKELDHLDSGSEFTHWIHWLNSFEPLAIDEDKTLLLLNWAKSSDKSVLIYAD